MRKLLRVAKRIANKIFGTKSDAWFWKFRHLFDRTWSESYISETSLAHPHRKLLIERIAGFSPESVLEIGCASGPNLILLARKLPSARLEGMDISASAVRTGERYLRLQGITNVKLGTGTVLDLTRFPDKSFDVVFTDAALIYVDAAHIGHIMAECERIAKKAIVLCEWNTEKARSFLDGHWVHHYAAFFPGRNVNVIKIPDTIWSGAWTAYGAIVDITLAG